MTPVKKQHTGVSRQRMYPQWAQRRTGQGPRGEDQERNNSNKRDNKKEHSNAGVKRAARADDSNQQVCFFIPLRWGNRKPAKGIGQQNTGSSEYLKILLSKVHSGMSEYFTSQGLEHLTTHIRGNDKCKFPEYNIPGSGSSP